MSPNKINKILTLLLFTASLMGSALQAQNISYVAHVANTGWMSWVSDGAVAGTTGQSLQMEAVEVALNNLGIASGIQYRAHVGDIGWQNWVGNASVAGTTGQSRRMEAFQIRLVNPSGKYSIRYRAHVAELGWLDWVTDGAVAGTTGQSRQMEALQIMIDYTPGQWTTPAYQPQYWNDGSTIQYYNNCYNYSNNRRTDSFAQPGKAGGDPISSVTAAEVIAGAISDGLEPTSAGATAPSGKTKIALVIWPGQDYHWYRQDSNGLWSHKPGRTGARNVDQSGSLISNPELANRGPYTQFAGYFFTPSDAVQGQGHANIK
jgi:hypothetical protein